MSWHEFIEARRAFQASAQTYVASLPVWVNVWRGWMFALFTSSVLFVPWYVEARWILLTTFASVMALDLLGTFMGGMSRFLSIALVVFWTPLIFYVFGRVRDEAANARRGRVFRIWLRVALATLAVSVMFDIYNVAHFFVVDSRIASK